MPVEVSSMKQWQRLVECVEAQKYKEAAPICQSLLAELNKYSSTKNHNKNKSDTATTTVDTTVKVALSELQLQLWLHLEQYSKIQQVSKDDISASVLKKQQQQRIEWYTLYRMKEYSKVIAQLLSASAKQQPESNDPFEQLLLAQCYFHESKMSDAGMVYQELLVAHQEKEDSKNEEDEDQVDTERYMELLTNRLAVLVADAIPYSSSSTTSHDCITAAAQLLEDPTSKQYYYDLTYNLGTYECATTSTTVVPSPTKRGGGSTSSKSWLDEAYRHCQLVRKGTSSQEEIFIILSNLQWSRQWKGSSSSSQSEESKVLDLVKKHGTPVAKAISNFNQVLAESMTINTKEKEEDASSNMSSAAMSFLQNKDLQVKSSWTPLQVKLYWYNRAILYFRAGQWENCRQMCQSLRETWSSASKPSSSSSKQGLAASVTPTKTDDLAWWETRCDIVLAHVQWNSKADASQATKMLQTRLDQLQALQSSTTTVDHAVAHVQLHLHYFNCISMRKQQPRLSESQLRQATIQLLEGFPRSVASRKAVVATLSSLYEEGNAGSTQSTDSAFLADTLLAQGQYEVAAAMYESVLPKTLKECTPEQVQETLRHVQALSHVNPKKAQELYKSVTTHLGQVAKASRREDHSEALDGESLEERELPRSTMETGSTAAALLASSGGVAEGTKSNGKSQDSILRRRARKKEAYLKKLASKGLYNPDRPIKPNPERWIPKRARGSHKKRGGGGTNHKGTQGSGGPDADLVKKLDAAARKAAGASGADASSVPSTANIKIASDSGAARKGGRRR
jgi:tetratricopeptide (TPR) repeat protein